MTIRPVTLVSLQCLLRNAVVLFAAVSLIALAPSLAHAQTNGGTNTTGSGQNAGGTQTGGATGAAADAGSSLTSQNVFSSTGDGAGQIGNNDGRFATSRLATQPTAGGTTNATQQNAVNQFRNLQRLNQQFNRTNQNRNNTNTQGTRTIRPSLRLGFVPKPRPTEDLRNAFDKQMKALAVKLPKFAAGRTDFASVEFEFGKSGEVILTGDVPTADSSRLLANIIRMEPGIASVRNELKVAQATAAE